MATRIESLFGIQSPQESYQNYLGGLMVSPQQMGSQGLYQQLISTMANAGALGGASLGRMMGGRTSEEVRSAAIQDAFKSVSGQKFENDWEKFDALAKELESKGMYDDAMRARKEARTMEATGLTTQKARKELQDVPKVIQLAKTVPDPIVPGKMTTVYTSGVQYGGKLYGSIEEFQRAHPDKAQGLQAPQGQPTGAPSEEGPLAGAKKALAKRQQGQQQAPKPTDASPTAATGDTRIDPEGGVPTQVRSPASPPPPPTSKERQNLIAKFSKEYSESSSQAERMRIIGKYREILTPDELGKIVTSLQQGM